MHALQYYIQEKVANVCLYKMPSRIAAAAAAVAASSASASAAAKMQAEGAAAASAQQQLRGIPLRANNTINPAGQAAGRKKGHDEEIEERMVDKWMDW